MSQTKAQLIDPVDGTIVNADINASAAIAGSKISPDFGSQNIVTTGGLTVDTSTLHVDSSNNRVGIGTSSPSKTLDIVGGEIRGHSNLSASHFNLRLKGQDTNTGGAIIAENSAGNAGPLLFFAGGSNQAMTLDSSGRLLVGTTTEGVANASKFTIADTGHCGMTIRSGTSHDGQIAFSDGTSGDDEFRGQIRYNHGSNFLNFVTDATERMRIDSSGNVGIGTSSPSGKLDVRGLITATITGTDVGLTIAQNGSGDILNLYDGGNLVFKVNSVGNPTVTSTNPVFASINSSSSVTTTLFSNSSGQGVLQTNSGSDLIFGTGSVEKVRITSAGNVGIGTSSPGSKLNVNGGTLIVRNDTNGQAIHQFQNRAPTSGSSAMTNELHFNFGRSNDSNMNLSGGRIVVGKEREWVGAAANQDSFMAIFTCQNETPTERVRVTSNGSLLIGVTQVGEDFGTYFSSDVNQRRTMNIGSSSTATQNQILFRNPNGRVGTIQTSGTSTSYSTTFSDIASKKNFENWTENVLSLFKNINPQKFNFKVEDDSALKSKGFVAQEMVDKFPEAYLKQEDEMYMFNPSGMVVYLMKAVQELESKLAALESA